MGRGHDSPEMRSGWGADRPRTGHAAQLHPCENCPARRPVQNGSRTPDGRDGALWEEGATGAPRSRAGRIARPAGRGDRMPTGGPWAAAIGQGRADLPGRDWSKSFRRRGGHNDSRSTINTNVTMATDRVEDQPIRGGL